MNIEIAGLTRRFGRNQAVAGVDLQAGPGVFGLLGPNGAGKTSLLRMMATVLPPSSGRLRLLDRDPGGYGPRREIRRRLSRDPIQAATPATNATKSGRSLLTTTEARRSHSGG